MGSVSNNNSKSQEETYLGKADGNPVKDVDGISRKHQVGVIIHGHHQHIHDAATRHNHS